MMTKKTFMRLAAILGCTMMMAVMTACTSDNADDPATVVEGSIAGN